MSSAAVIAIAIGALVVLAAIAFVTMARRQDVRGAGALATETRKRDDAARRARAAAEAAATRAEGGDAAGGVAVLTAEEAERAGEEARRPSTALVKAAPAVPEPWSPPDPEAIGVSRRQFFNRASVTLMAASITTFTAAGFIAFLWPSAGGGFGQVVRVGQLDDIRAGARANFGFFYAPSARTWITEYPEDALPEAETVYDEPIYRGMQQHGLVALYQKCPHLGCRVPNCDTSRWFECPCHGSQYNQVGEKKAGPAPRGMDHFAFQVDAGGNVDVDTGTVYEGPPIGTNTTGQEAEGPHCITEGGDH